MVALAAIAVDAEQTSARETIEVPQTVAVLISPILDIEAESLRLCRSTKPQSCTEGREREEEAARSAEVERLTTDLLHRKGSTANEALVVLLCYYIGEGNGEDLLFSTTSRGRQMLSPLRKYARHTPRISNRSYPDGLRLSLDTKKHIFDLAIDSIEHGRDLTPTE